MKFQILKAERCAWRGRYLNLNGRQIARITLDPTGPYGPKLSVAFGFGNWSNVFDGLARKILWKTHIDFSFRLPHIPYRWVARFRCLLPLYRLSQRFWLSLDGRGIYYK